MNGCVEDRRASTGREKEGMPSAQRESDVRPMKEGAGSGKREDSVNRREESEKVGWREGSDVHCEVKSKG